MLGRHTLSQSIAAGRGGKLILLIERQSVLKEKELTMKKILVTGGAGFIGSNFIYHQLRHHPEDQIVCLDALTYAGNLENLKNAIEQKRFSFVKGDIADRGLVFALFEREGFDLVVNFAAESHVDRSIEDSQAFLRTNVLGTHVLLDACRQYGTPRFHQVSTDEVYGDLPLDRPDLLFTEETPLRPSSPYSASKASADLLVMAYHRTYQMPVSLSRCSNNYGRYQFPEKLIPLMILRATNNQALPIYGNGKNVRDWLYVADHCRAVDLILRDPGSVGEVYNIGGNTERSNLEVVQGILRILGKSESLIEYVADRPGHDLRYAIDSSKLSSRLGFVPETTFEDGLLQTVTWYRQHEDWWRRILQNNHLI